MSQEGITKWILQTKPNARDLKVDQEQDGYIISRVLVGHAWESTQKG